MRCFRSPNDFCLPGRYSFTPFQAHSLTNPKKRRGAKMLYFNIGLLNKGIECENKITS